MDKLRLARQEDAEAYVKGCKVSQSGLESKDMEGMAQLWPQHRNLPPIQLQTSKVGHPVSQEMDHKTESQEDQAAKVGLVQNQEVERTGIFKFGQNCTRNATNQRGQTWEKQNRHWLCKSDEKQANHDENQEVLLPPASV